MKNTLPKNNLTVKNLSLWLWMNNDRPKVVASVNYKLEDHVQGSFSLKGQKCRNTWQRFDSSQKPHLQRYFRAFKSEWEQKTIDFDFNFRCSKLFRNTDSKGLKQLPGCIIVLETSPDWSFVVDIAEQEFQGQFSTDGLSDKQIRMGCVGLWTWEEEVEDDEEDLW